MRCPICGKQFSQDDPQVALPFCSERCRKIDAKRWFNEEYSIETVNLEQLERQIAQIEENPEENNDEPSV